MAAPEGTKQVRETWMLYDTVRIGPALESKDHGWFQNFTQLAAADSVNFLNVRNSSDVGAFYTNITSKDKLPWPFVLESIGIRFGYPDPNIPPPGTAQAAASKLFQELIPEHAHLDFFIREDMRLRLKPHMMPAGYGTVGLGVLIPSASYVGVLENGNVNLGNRFQWLTELNIPDDTPVKAELRFSEYAKALLTAWATVNPLDGPQGEELNNEAFIELSLRGQRWVQQRGEYYAS